MMNLKPDALSSRKKVKKGIEAVHRRNRNQNSSAFPFRKTAFPEK